jgi:hypothetical protein
MAARELLYSNTLLKNYTFNQSFEEPFEMTEKVRQNLEI